jgi:redox-sensitive bicupin YhaK (pirin superfamily)
MIRLRKSEDRGSANFGWLDTRYTFSFSGYYDPEFTGFRTLRVLNDDRIAPGSGFGEHPHEDMEIITIVLEGALHHRDSTGSESIITPGVVQRMSAGTGIRHSEFNASTTDPLHLLQIWIEPDTKGIRPGYDEKSFEPSDWDNRLGLIASPDGKDGSLLIRQNVAVYATRLSPGRAVEYKPEDGRDQWIQVATGEVRLNDLEMSSGDGAAVSGESVLRLEGVRDALVLVFDLD